jgi:hypothetical protein
MLGAMALLIAGAMALPAGAVAIPFLGIMAGVAGAMGVKNMADMAGITPGKGNKRKIDGKLDDAKIEVIEKAITELKKNNHQGLAKSPDSSQSLASVTSISQNTDNSATSKEILTLLKDIAQNIGNKDENPPTTAKFVRTLGGSEREADQKRVSSVSGGDQSSSIPSGGQAGKGGGGRGGPG